MDYKKCSRDIGTIIAGLFEISNAVTSTDKPVDFFISIHTSLNKILTLENLAIALNYERRLHNDPVMMDAFFKIK